MSNITFSRFRKNRKKALKRNPRIKVFERRYTELGPSLIPEQRRIDYVLIHSKKKSTDYTEDKQKDKREALEEKERKRQTFEVRIEDRQKDDWGRGHWGWLECLRWKFDFMYIGIYSLWAILAKMTIGRSLYFSLSHIFATSWAVNWQLLQCLIFTVCNFSDFKAAAN